MTQKPEPRRKTAHFARIAAALTLVFTLAALALNAASRDGGTKVLAFFGKGPGIDRTTTATIPKGPH